ncbi:mannosyl-oligosaccharide alpha-1,2-mannosidase-like protein [Myxozyma melibiosi]|uniref:alpha-1,2-Mannosidase n=1 Tax=Myxozyma melibiosi TaxID=54550 RepID=A0ABR1EZB5_9ASCO
MVWTAPKRRGRTLRILRMYYTPYRRFILYALALLVIIRYLYLSFHTTHPTVQFNFKEHPLPHSATLRSQARADEIKKEFKWAFDRYRAVAWGKDEVLPVSGGFKTTRNGFAATLVDSLTTALVMNLTQEATLTLDYVLNKLDFSKHDEKDYLMDPFETTIRYLGSLVSAADILASTDIFGPIPNQEKYRTACLEKAIDLAHIIAPAYDTPTGIPWPRVDLSRKIGVHEDSDPEYASMSREVSPTLGPARIGSNWLENYRLSKLVGNKEYVTNATRSWSSLVWNSNDELFDGLISSPIDAFTGYAVGKSVSLGAGHDSYYEYLIKAAILAPSDKHASMYSHRWEQAMQSTRLHLAHRGSAPQSYTSDGHRPENGYLFIAHVESDLYYNEMGHLTCFLPGNLLLGGKFLSRPDLIDFGLDVLDTCHATYVMPTNLGPESFVWEAYSKESEELDGGMETVRWAIEKPGPHELEQVRKLGFWVSDARYFLRPEVIESYYYAFRITGDEKYREWAWAAYTGLKRFCKAKFGYGEVQDVTLPDGGGTVVDSSESFFLAETLKYLFMIFDDPERMPLDKWVFSTEAHPFRID